ncbi:MAG: ABC transporter ATP-binding protein [Thermodesulfobacteriota bacterium]|nr:ABC transporter ATP-binding protein [Thermodesulfobacteriota bacterium]
MLELEDCSFTYPSMRVPAFRLSGSVRWKCGEVVVVSGECGSGKTTLAKLISGIIPLFEAGVFEGDIRINGKLINQLTPEERIKLVGCVLEDSDLHIFTTSVWDEMTLGSLSLNKDAEEIAGQSERELQSWQLLEKKEKHPLELSGGERQRLAIASIMARSPKIMVLDNPFSQLDMRNRQSLREKLIKYAHGGNNLVVLLLPEGEQADFADRLFSLEGGELQPFRPHGDVHSETLQRSRNKSQPESVVLTAESLEFVYPDNTKALNGVNLEIRKGTWVTITGENGSGKSTLLKILAGVLQPQKGKIWLNGKDVKGWLTKERARIMQMLFQDINPQVLCPTIWELSILPSKIVGQISDKSRENNLKKCLESSELYNRKDSDPFNLRISERQLLLLISLLFAAPLVLLLDEPFSRMSRREQEIAALWLNEFCEEGGTILCTSHGGLPIRWHDIEFRMVDGCLVETEMTKK